MSSLRSGLCSLLVLLLLAACGAPADPPADTAVSPAGDSAAGHPSDLFADRAAELGLDFVHFNGMTGQLYFPEMTGGGSAFFDYDNDGDLDVYLVQGDLLSPGETLADALVQPVGPLPPSDRLYRNDLAPGPGGRLQPRFIDVTAQAQLPAGGYGMGVASGDYDNDGWTDLYVTQLGSNRLLRNRGPGAGGQVTFEDVTADTGTDDPRWSVAAVFFDYDRDGWLDLYVGNYLDFTLATHKICRTEGGAPDYCGPLSFRPEPDRLLRNRGRDAGGRVRFENVTERAGLGTPGATLGAVPGDFNGDGWLDLYVANDGMDNHLWVNQQDGTFRNEALLAGVAVNREGQPEASMGVDAGDVDQDGDEDLFMTHLTRETNTLYRNLGGGLFEDVTPESGLGPPSLPFTGFGTVFFDFDLDGDLDLLVANGAVRLQEAQQRAGDVYALHQTNQLFRNLGDGRFEEATAEGGDVFRLSEVSRGVAVGDADNDGDPDALVVNSAGPVRLLLNQQRSGRHWLGLRLVGGGDVGGRDLLGARVELIRPDGTSLVRRVRTAGSYASASDPRLLFGLGGDPAVAQVRVHWPDGRREQWQGLRVDAYTTLRQGDGQPLP